MIASRRPRLLPVARLIASSPTCDHDKRNTSLRRKPVCGARSTAWEISTEHVFFSAARSEVVQMISERSPPVEPFDSLAWVAGNLAERVHGVGKHPGKHLHPEIGRSWLVGPLIAPAADERPDFFRPIELRNTKTFICCASSCPTPR